MSNLFSYVLGFIFVIPIMLFGIDLTTLQTVSAGLEAYATTITLKASTGGLNNGHYLEAEAEGYQLVCLVGCEYPQVGQTQSFVLQKAYTPLFISNDIITVTVKRTFIVGYY